MSAVSLMVMASESRGAIQSFGSSDIASIARRGLPFLVRLMAQELAFTVALCIQSCIKQLSDMIQC